MKVNEESDFVTVECERVSFRSRKVGICTNVFTKNIVDKQLDIAPGRGIVMSIQPEQSLKFEGTFHYEEGYYYFRDYYGKLLFGGGRNMAIEEETTQEFGINNKIKEKLLSDLEEIILPGQKFKIELEWSGIMAFGENKSPIIEEISEKIVQGVRLGGMGVAIGSLVGEEVAELLLK